MVKRALKTDFDASIASTVSLEITLGWHSKRRAMLVIEFPNALTEKYAIS